MRWSHDGMNPVTRATSDGPRGYARATSLKGQPIVVERHRAHQVPSAHRLIVARKA